MTQRSVKWLLVASVGLIAILFGLDQLMVMTWEGSRDVRVEFDSDFQALGPTLLRYDNAAFQAIDEQIRVARSFSDSIDSQFNFVSQPELKNGVVLLRSKGSGKKSALITYYEHWQDGFIAEVTVEDGSRYLAWAQVDFSVEKPVVTFTLANAARIRSSERSEKISAPPAPESRP